MIFVTLLTWCFWVLTAVNLIFVLRDLLRFDLRLDSRDRPVSDQGRVSLIVPMRDEVANVDRCLAAIRRQTYRDLEVIVVDDGSTDGTSERLDRLRREWPDLRVLTLDGPPPGWAGKTNALHRGVEASSGDWLLFIDADVILSEEAVGVAVRAACDNGWPILSLHGSLSYDSFWERTLQLPMAILTHGYQLMMPGTVLNGQFILIRRSVYEEVGGFVPIRGAVVEDAALAHRLVDRGHPPRVRVWTGAYRCRMYTSRRHMWEGFTRMLAGYNGFRAAPLLMAALMYSTVLVPQLFLIGLGMSALLGGPSVPSLAAASGALVGVHIVVALIIAHRLGAPLSAILLKPIADLTVAGVLLDSARRAASGGVTWKGRRYTGAPGSLRPPPTAASAPSPADPPIRLSIVVPLPNQAGGGDRDMEGAIRPVIDAARGLADVEVIAVHTGPGPAAASGIDGLRLVQAEAGSPWDLRRRGVETAMAPLTAVLAAVPDDPSMWIESTIAAFDDPAVDLVTGPVRWAGAGAMAAAASIREWGHLVDPWTHYPSPENFGGRREALLGLLPTGELSRTEGTILLGMQAALDEISFKVLEGAAATAAGGDPGAGSIMTTMTDRLTSVTAMTIGAWRSSDRQPSFIRLWIRSLPLTITGDTALLTIRTLRSWCDRYRIAGLVRPAVVVWLCLLYGLDILLALGVTATWRHRFPERESAEKTADSSGWRCRILGIARRMLVCPRHRRVSAS